MFCTYRHLILDIVLNESLITTEEKFEVETFEVAHHIVHRLRVVGPNQARTPSVITLINI